MSEKPKFKSGDFIWEKDKDDIAVVKVDAILKDCGKYKVYYTWVRCISFPQIVGYSYYTTRFDSFKLLSEQMKAEYL